MRSPPYGKIARLNGCVGLQTDNHFIFAIDIAGLVGQHGRRRLRVDGKDALLPFVLEIGLKLMPRLLLYVLMAPLEIDCLPNRA